MTKQSEARWAAALAAALEQLEQGADLSSVLAGCPDAETREALRPLLSLGTSLHDLPSAPDASDSFKDSLAAALSAAPAPSSLAEEASAAEALDALLAEQPSAPDELASDFDAEATSLAPLIDLATNLRDLPKAESPSAEFRQSLAAALESAARPSSLATQDAAGNAVTDPEKHSTGELVQGLDHGLSRLQSGRNRDEIAAESPEFETELAPLFDIAQALGALPEVDGPGEAFQENLAAKLAFAPEPRAIRNRKTRASAPNSLVRRLWRSTAFMAAAAATVIMFISAGVTYASADALPGELLYPVKRAAENARVWLASDENLALVHLGLADERLHEAVLVPSTAGLRLADFSSEVTKALVSTDLALALGIPQETVTPPVLDWLLDARVRLIDRRQKLPPTAWRASLAMVDEAIHALRFDRPLTIRPVPRLLGRDLTMASASPLIGSRSLVRVPEDELESPDPDPAPVLAASDEDSREATLPVKAIGAPFPAPQPVQPEPVQGDEPAPAAPVQDEDDDDDDDRDRNVQPDPAPEDPEVDPAPKPLDPIVVPITPFPTQELEPTDVPTALPTTVPTALPTTAPTAVPTAEPTATTEPTSPPTIVEIICWPKVVVDAGEATCEARVENTGSMDITYEWSVVEFMLGHVEQRDYTQPHLGTFISTPPPSGLVPGSPEVHVQLRLLDAYGLLVDDLTGVIEVYYGDEEAP